MNWGRMIMGTVRHRHVRRAGIVILMAAFMTAPAMAQSLTPVANTLTQLTSTLKGPIATSLAILAVIAAGFAAWAGYLTWRLAGSIIAGIVLVFGSAQIVAFFQSAAGG